MKKNILILCMLGASALTANGQTLLKGTKFTDNWSVGINGGVTTPMTHSAFWKNSRPAVSIELSKRITPVLSLGTSVMGHINTSSSKTAFDASNVELLSKFNMMNLFAGYPGTPRTFEMEAVNRSPLYATWNNSLIASSFKSAPITQIRPVKSAAPRRISVSSGTRSKWNHSPSAAATIPFARKTSP